MPGLLDSNLAKPLDPTLKGNDLLAQTSLLQLVNNPHIQDPNMSAADKLEQQQNAAMLAEAVGGPSAEEQAAQANANPSLRKRKGPAKPAPPAEGASNISPATPAGIETSIVAPSVPVAGISMVSSSSSPAVHKIFFTGRSGVGKSFLADLIGAKTLEFNAPLSLLWTGPAPAAPDFAKLIAWANGTFSSNYPNTPERVSFVQMARLLFSMDDFGRENFLVNYLIKEAASVDTGIIAVTDVQTSAEFQLLVNAGFKHYHVAASQTTMASRNKRQRDEALAAHLDGQASTLMQRQPQGDKKPVVWSDPITASPCQRFYTVEEFKQLLVQPAPAAIEGVEL